MDWTPTAVLLVAIAASLLIYGAIWAAFRPSAAAVAVLATACLPLFLDPRTWTLTLTRAWTGATGEPAGAIHFAVGVTALVATVMFLRHLGHPLPLFAKGWFLLLGALWTVALAAGLLGGGGGIVVVYYIQTIVPLFAWYAVAAGSVPPARALTVVLWGALVTTALVLGIGLGTSGGYNAVAALVSVIPQYRAYFALVPAAGVAFAAVSMRSQPRASLAMLAVTAIALPLMWSRAGLAMIAVAGVVAFLAQPGRGRLPVRLVLLVAAAILSGSVLLHRVFTGVVGIREVTNSTEEEISNGRRRLLAEEALERVGDSPLFGDAFTPFGGHHVAGKVAELNSMFPAHNQYLDLALRGGIAPALVTTLLLVVFARRAWRITREGGPAGPFHAGLLGIIAAVAVGNMTHLWMIQAWSGCLLFALLGVSSSYRSDPDEPDRHASRRATTSERA